MVKFVGQDKGGVAGSTVRQPSTNITPLNQSDKSFQFAAQQYQQTGEALKGSLQFQSQLASRISQDVQQTNATLAETRSKTIQYEGGDNGFGQAMNTIAGVGKMVVDTLDARAKREAAQARAVREGNAAAMWERVSKWETEAPKVAKFDPGGTVKLRSQLDDMFNTPEGQDLLLEDRTALMKHAYGNVITGLVTKSVDSLAKQQEEVTDANRNLRKEKAVFEASGLISGLTAASNVDEQQASIGKLREYMAAIAQSGELQPLDKAEMQMSIVSLMSKAKFASDDTRLKAEEVMQQYASFEEDVRKAREAYPDNVEAQETMIAASAWKNKIPTELSKRYTITDAQERRLNQLSMEEKEREIKERKTAYDIGGVVGDDEAGFDAVTFDNDSAANALAATLGNGNIKVGKETPRYQQYLAAREALKKFRTNSQKLAEEGARILLDKQKLGASDAQSMIGYLKDLKPSPQANIVIEQLRIATGNNPALGALLPQIGKYHELDAANKRAFEDRLTQAQEALLDARQGIVGAMDELYRVKTQEVEANILEIAKYGFRRNGTYDPARAKAVEERRLQREAQRAAKYAQQGGDGGGVQEPANFNRVAGANYFNPLKTLYTHTNPERGDLILPVTAAEIKRQGPGNYNEGVGWRAWANRQHNGQDYGLDEGTPIVSHMDAVVTKVEHQASGAGHYIELKYPDGTYHVQMHLYERPNLTVGQRVKAGQIVGKVGNSGLGGGPSNAHLHWEVWNSDGSRSTPQAWSKQFRERIASSGGQGRQPGTPGRGSSVTAPRGVPGVAIQGGTLTPNGKGGASVVTTGGKDSGQQRNKVTPAKPPGKASAGVFVGPNGKLWGRDNKGVPYQIPEQAGSSGGVSSVPSRFNNAAHVRNLRSSNRPGDYSSNDLRTNHGFKALKDNPNHAIAINSAAKQLGVPGEWLAEVISIETGNTFDPAIKEYGGSGATGIIQFFPDHDGGSYKTINGKRYELAAIGKMTLEQQVRGPMMDYIREAMNANGMKKIDSIQDLYSLVWAYGPASKARRMRDIRGPSGTEILNRLGKYSGRRYSSNATPSSTIAESYDSPRTNKLTQPVDRTYHASCSTCNQMASLNMFVPHDRNILNRGMETFNLA